MTIQHVPALAEVGLEPELWRLQPAPICTLEDMRRYVENALDEYRKGSGLPFVIMDRETERVTFEELGVQRVVFKTEVLNEQSRKAIARLGAIEEGTFRKHLIAASGRARDMVYFSILDTEWPSVREGLQRRLR